MKKPWRTLLALAPCIALLCVLGGCTAKAPASSENASPQPENERPNLLFWDGRLYAHWGHTREDLAGLEWAGSVFRCSEPWAPRGQGGDQCSPVAVRVGVDRPRGGAVRGCSWG